ncbi:hypothetical protein BVRB_9g213070 isoform B [Beta vulgaris subsp. vulgaris]|nr:hypothetical protein BVRB_9g213070 isoform B [Beta vulgaris subsp. vulgaris]
MKFESQGSIIGPELVTPNSSSAILRSSLKISLFSLVEKALGKLSSFKDPS